MTDQFVDKVHVYIVISSGTVIETNISTLSLNVYAQVLAHTGLHRYSLVHDRPLHYYWYSNTITVILCVLQKVFIYVSVQEEYSYTTGVSTIDRVGLRSKQYYILDQYYAVYAYIYAD